MIVKDSRHTPWLQKTVILCHGRERQSSYTMAAKDSRPIPYPEADEMEERGDTVVREKWRDERGETLIEAVASILIMTLSVLLLFSAVIVSVRINGKAKELDQAFYSVWNAAEEQSTEALPGIVPAGSTVKVKQISPASTSAASVKVSFYGGEGVLSYLYKP